MSEGENHHHGKNEIIIVKRHKGGHDGAHGGAWKIAYADFMTAMMAFFLVMWLVNAANEETKASVASYFNPIKLSDEKPSSKGLEKPVDKEEGVQKKDQSNIQAEKVTKGSAAATGEDLTSQTGEQSNFSEADFSKIPIPCWPKLPSRWGSRPMSAPRARAALPIPARRRAQAAAKPIAIPSIPISGPSR